VTRIVLLPLISVTTNSWNVSQSKERPGNPKEKSHALKSRCQKREKPRKENVNASAVAITFVGVRGTTGCVTFHVHAEQNATTPEFTLTYALEKV